MPSLLNIKAENSLSKLDKKIESILSNFRFDSGIDMEILSEKERFSLESNSKIIHVRKNAVLYREGESPKGAYIILQGKIKVSQQNVSGATKLLFVYTTGELFGHRPILSREDHPVTATAHENCQLLFIAKEHFVKVVNSSESLTQNLMRSISHEFTVWVNLMSIFAQKGVKGRLALALLLLNDKFKTSDQPLFESEIKISRYELASFVGTTIETICRIVKDLKEEKYIQTAGRSIYINDFEGLLKLSGCSL